MLPLHLRVFCAGSNRFSICYFLKLTTSKEAGRENVVGFFEVVNDKPKPASVAGVFIRGSIEWVAERYRNNCTSLLYSIYKFLKGTHNKYSKRSN